METAWKKYIEFFFNIPTIWSYQNSSMLKFNPREKCNFYLKKLKIKTFFNDMQWRNSKTTKVSFWLKKYLFMKIINAFIMKLWNFDPFYSYVKESAYSETKLCVAFFIGHCNNLFYKFIYLYIWKKDRV